MCTGNIYGEYLPQLLALTNLYFHPSPASTEHQKGRQLT